MADNLERRLTLAILGRTAPDAAREVMGIMDGEIKRLRDELAKDIEVELSMCAIANDEASSEWIDGFEFAWKRVRVAMEKR